MKTIEEFLKEIEGSEELKKEYDNITDDAGLDAFLKKLDCEATADEFIKYIDDYAGTEGVISDDAVEDIAGGGLAHPPHPPRLYTMKPHTFLVR